MSTLSPKLFTTLKGYTKAQFFKDLTAGTIVAIIALPLSIALAIASGVSPEKGIYTAIIAGFIISFLGGSRVQIGGPTGAFMVIVYGIVMQYGLDGLMIATMMAGVIMILFGLLKLGSVIKFIPYPITTGFTSGIAVTIFTSQIKDFMGLTTDELPADFLGKWAIYLKTFDTTDWMTVLVGVLALIIIIGWRKISKKIPGAFVALIVTSVLVYALKLPVATIGTKYGTLSAALPALHIPELNMDKVKMLVEPAFTIAILGSVESLLSAVVSDGMIGGKHRSNMELVAQGTANIASAAFGGIPATGAIARTVANIKNGGRTPVAGMVHAVVLFLIMMLFMPLVKQVPLAALAAVLIVVAYNMSEWREFIGLFKAPKSDILVMLIVFIITVLVDLVRAIEIGMVLAVFLFMKRMSEVSNINPVTLDAAEEGDEPFDFVTASKQVEHPDMVEIYEINGPFFFGAADKFVATLSELGHRTRALIIRMRNVPAMDATALKAFKQILKSCKRKGITVYVTGINEQPLAALTKAGITEQMGEHAFFENVEEAVAFAKAAYDSAQKRAWGYKRVKPEQ